MSRYTSDEVGKILNAEIAAVLSYTAAVAREMGLGVPEIAALEHLQGAGELTPGQLGKRLSMTSGAVTALVDRMEKRGFVERHPNPRDRRSSVLRVTPEAEKQAMRYLAPLGVEVRGITGQLSDEERDAVGRFMQDLTSALLRQTPNA